MFSYAVGIFSLYAIYTSTSPQTNEETMHMRNS